MNHGAANHGAANHGAANHEAKNYSARNHGIMSDSTISHEDIGHGTVSHGTVSHGAAPGVLDGAAPYEQDGAEIYRRSFAMIRAEADLTAIPDDLEHVVVRMIHACGMTDLPADLAWSDGVGTAARAALAAGGTILCDSSMVAAGVTRSRLPAGNQVVCTLAGPRPSRPARDYPFRRRRRVVARPPRRRGRGRGERPDGAVPIAGNGRGRRSAAGGRAGRPGDRSRGPV